MEPLTFKIITDADDAGVKKYDQSLGGLNTTSQKAGAALRSFSRQALEAKSGTELAAAGANALSQAFQKSLLATSVIGGIKIVSDQIKNMGNLIKEAGQATATALSQVQKLGETTSFEDASKKANIFQSALDENIKRLNEIRGGNWFVKLQGDITGVTRELEAQNQTLQRNIDAQIAFGLEVEKQRKLRMIGMTEEAKAQQAIDDRRARNLEEAAKIKDPTLRDEAQKAAVDISRLEQADLAKKETEKRNLEQNKKIIEDQKIADMRRKDAMDEYQRGLDQQNEKTAQESKDFFDRIKKGEDLKKESVALQEKTLDAQDRVDAARKRVVEADAKVADLLLRATGTGRGFGQRASSAEIGAQKAAERAFQSEQRKLLSQSYEDFKLASEIAGLPSNRYAFNRYQQEKLEKKARQEAQAPFTEQKEAKDALNSAESYLENIEKLLEDNLTELRTYAAVA